MNILFNGLPIEDAKSWLAKMQCQPATGWADALEYAGWQIVPSVYLICENDNAIPVGVQEQVAMTAGSEIERCSSGHMVSLTMLEKVVEVVRKAAGEVF